MSFEAIENLMDGWVKSQLALILLMGLVWVGIMGCVAWCGIKLTKSVVRWIDAKTREQEIETELGKERALSRPSGQSGADDKRFMPKNRA